ncbi:hypothetical protein CRYUN_Cryun16bG0051100 [Craigia yunnanensis]
MSVIEPVTQRDLKTRSLLHSGKNMDVALLTYNADEDQKQVFEGLEEKGSEEKEEIRQVWRWFTVHKMVKGVTNANNEAIPLQV